MASTSSRKGMLRGKAGEVSWDPDQKEPSVISGNGIYIFQTLYVIEIL